MQLLVGDPAPWFICPSDDYPAFHFSQAAGHNIVLFFMGSAGLESTAEVLRFFTTELRNYFDDRDWAFFGVSIDPQDKQQRRIEPILRGFHYFWDFEGNVSRQYGALAETAQPQEKAAVTYYPFTLILDPTLRVLANIPLIDVGVHNKQVGNFLAGYKNSKQFAERPQHAPVLILPRIFEAEDCRQLIDIYNTFGGERSGFMGEKDGYTVGQHDDKVKRRSDCNLKDKPEYAPLIQRLDAIIYARLLPEIRKAFQYHVTYIERHIVACYDAADEGFFSPHRDNTTKGTAHRRFAVTINLNAEEYEGGDLAFPEFGPQTYRAPTGGAVVFSCSLLHEAKPVTKGKRYAYLPFLYDDEAQKIREQNLSFLIAEKKPVAPK